MPAGGVGTAVGSKVFLGLSGTDINARQVSEGLWAQGLKLEIFTCGADLLKAFDADVPSCTLLDIGLPPSGGLDALAKLRRRRPSAPVLMIGQPPSIRVAIEAMRLGADDVLDPGYDPYLLQTRIQQLVERDGQTVEAERACADRRRRIATLSRRERQVLDLILQGLSNKETARVLDVSPKAIEIYRAGMMRKLGQRSSVAMARWVSACWCRCADPLNDAADNNSNLVFGT